VQREAAEAGELAQLVVDRLGELGRNLFGVGQPGGDPRGRRHAEQRRLHLVGRQPPWLVHPVQRGRVPGEPALPVGEPAVQR
jgi:hypothetical protein